MRTSTRRSVREDPKPSQGFALVGRFPLSASVWRVVASPDAAFVTLPGGFAKPRDIHGSFNGFPLIAAGGVGVLHIASKHAGVVRLVFDAAPPQGQTRTLRLADSKTRAGVSARGQTTRVGAGRDPAGSIAAPREDRSSPTSEDDAIVISAPRAETTSGQSVLHADVVSADPGF